MKRALVIKFGAIGDVVMAIPGARALFEQGYRIDWVCGAVVAPVLRLYPWINVVVGDDRAIVSGSRGAKLRALAGLWRAIAGPRYDLAATLYYDRRYRLLALPVRAGRKVMLSTTERETRLLPGRHHTDEFARVLLGRPDGVQPVAFAPVRPERMPDSPLARVEGRKRVAMAPGGAKNMLREDALRRWPVESYVEVAREMIGLGMEVVLIGGAEDVWVREGFAGLPVTDCLGRFSLTETIGLLDGCEVLLTHDTGPLHLAGITSAGIVAVFGPTDPRGRMPQRRNSVALWGGEGFGCRPCYDGRDYAPCPDNACVRQVTPEMAARAVLRVMAERADGGAPPRVETPESTVRA